jgi:hypothetical protein
MQKWDYKTVKLQAGGGGYKFEVDGQADRDNSEKPLTDFLKELGAEGWELVASTCTYMMPNVVSMPNPNTIPLRNEKGEIHEMRQPTLLYWWIFKRPL